MSQSLYILTICLFLGTILLVFGMRFLSAFLQARARIANSRRGTVNMSHVSTFRLYVLRATYLVMFIGLAVYVWPGIIHHGELGPAQGVVRSFLGAVAVLALLGIRYPLQLLPLMFFELVWKSIWLIAMALPLWFADQ